MKINIFILLLISFVIVSCKDIYYTHTAPLKESELPIECEGLVDEINKYWKKSKKYGYYTTTDKTFPMQKLVVKYQYQEKCLTQLDTSQIKQLIGEPNQRDKWRLIYFLEKECITDIYWKGCKHLVFFYGENGQINKIDTAL